jgi:hypothetical protein
MNLKQRLVQLLEYAYRKEQIFIQNLTDEERSIAGNTKEWSAKDTIAHIAAWKGWGSQVLAALRYGEPGSSSGFDDLAAFNAKVFEEAQALTWDQVLDKSRQVHHTLREQTEATEDVVLVAPEGLEQQNEPVWWLVVGIGCTHALEHLTEYCIKHGRAAIAIEMQEEAAELLLQLDGPNWKVYYGLAGHYAAAGLPEKAIDALGKALSYNPKLVEQSRDDPRFACLREHPGYRALCRT